MIYTVEVKLGKEINPDEIVLRSGKIIGKMQDGKVVFSGSFNPDELKTIVNDKIDEAIRELEEIKEEIDYKIADRVIALNRIKHTILGSYKTNDNEIKQEE